MTRKEIVNATLKATMTMKELTDALATLDFDTKISVAKNVKNIRNIYDASGKNKFASVEIIEASVKTKKTSKKAKATEPKERKNKNAALYAECDRTPVKEVGNGYVVYYAMKADEDGQITVNDEMTTCKQIKNFIKELHSLGRVTVLNIYKMGENYANDSEDIHKTRISAWVGQEVTLA